MPNFDRVAAGQDLKISASLINSTIDLLQADPETNIPGRRSKSPPAVAMVYPTANLGKGKYKGKAACVDAYIIPTDTALSIDDLFKSGFPYFDCIIFNWAELGRNTNTLTAGIAGATTTPPSIAIRHGRGKNGTSGTVAVLPIYHTYVRLGKPC